MNNANTTYKWFLKIRPDAQHAFDRLRDGEKQAIFRHLTELLTAENPYTMPFVEMLQAGKFERTRKFRVGDYRVFFDLQAVEITVLGHKYKGTLFLVDIRNRKEAY